MSRPIRNLILERITICDDVEELDLRPTPTANTAAIKPRLDAWGLRWQHLLEVLPLHPHKHGGRWYQGRKIHLCLHSDMSQEDFMKAWREQQ